MPYRRGQYTDHSELIATLYALKTFHDIGIYDQVTRGAPEIDGGDLYEFLDLGIECVAPIFDCDDVSTSDSNDMPAAGEEAEGEYYDDYHYHRQYHLSSPQMQEYYRLCRLYEHREKIEPESNPFVIKADRYYRDCLSQVRGYFWAGFNDDRYPRELLIEVCFESYSIQPDLIEALHNMLSFYSDHLLELRVELLKGAPVFLPALPAPKEV